jgi:hypothetical protein
MTTGALTACVEAALAQIAKADQSVTFSLVAITAGVARATLYRDPTLRALVEEHRARQHEAGTFSGLNAEIGHLRTAVEGIATRVRQQEERLRRLEDRPASKTS